MSAGLKGLNPSPPYNCLQIIMAKKPPMTDSHHGEPGGRVRANRRPVTAALPSLITIL